MSKYIKISATEIPVRTVNLLLRLAEIFCKIPDIQKMC